MIKERTIEAVVIGASMGGLDAISRIVSCLSADISFTVIIVLHRLKNLHNLLPGLLASKTKVPVKEADEKEKVESGHIYVAPADYHLLIEDDKTFSLDASEKVNYSRPAIDVTFESASGVWKEKLLGIVLTGANHDGSAGLSKIIKAGGEAIVQDPDEAHNPTMPASALRASQTPNVLTLQEICNLLDLLTNRKP